MKGKQFKNKVSQMFYKPKRKKTIRIIKDKELDEIEEKLDKRIVKFKKKIKRLFK